MLYITCVAQALGIDIIGAVKVIVFVFVVVDTALAAFFVRGSTIPILPVVKPSGFSPSVESAGASESFAGDCRTHGISRILHDEY